MYTAPIQAPGTMIELRQTFHLAAPIIAGQVGQMLMGWVDTIMIGHIGVTPLAACALANTILAFFFVFGFGLMSCVSVCASQAFGAGSASTTANVYRAGLFLGSVVGLGMAILVMLTIPILPYLGQPTEVARQCVPYLVLVGWSIVPLMLTSATKGFAEALAKPWIPFWIVMTGVGINVWLNWIFIYGNWGAPAMGLTGAALATLLSRFLILAGLIVYLQRSRKIRPYRIAPTPQWIRQLGPMLKVGWPAGGQTLAEVSGFAFASIMIGWLGEQALAAHQIAITCAATTFMVPLGLGIALTVRMGQAYGAGQLHRLRRISFGAVGASIAFMSCSAAAFILFGPDIAGWFIKDTEVLKLTASLLIVAGIFQVFDGVQISTIGALRGIGDVKVPMWIVIFSFWGGVLPLAYFMAFRMQWGVLGIWCGFILGLAVASLALSWRLAYLTSPLHLQKPAS